MEKDETGLYESRPNVGQLSTRLQQIGRVAANWSDEPCLHNTTRAEWMHRALALAVENGYDCVNAGCRVGWMSKSITGHEPYPPPLERWYDCTGRPVYVETTTRLLDAAEVEQCNVQHSTCLGVVFPSATYCSVPRHYLFAGTHRWKAMAEWDQVVNDQPLALPPAIALDRKHYKRKRHEPCLVLYRPLQDATIPDVGQVAVNHDWPIYVGHHHGRHGLLTNGRHNLLSHGFANFSKIGYYQRVVCHVKGFSAPTCFSYWPPSTPHQWPTCVGCDRLVDKKEIHCTICVAPYCSKLCRWQHWASRSHESQCRLVSFRTSTNVASTCRNDTVLNAQLFQLVQLSFHACPRELIPLILAYLVDTWMYQRGVVIDHRTPDQFSESLVYGDWTVRNVPSSTLQAASVVRFLSNACRVFRYNNSGVRSERVGNRPYWTEIQSVDKDWEAFECTNDGQSRWLSDTEWTGILEHFSDSFARHGLNSGTLALYIAHATWNTINVPDVDTIRQLWSALRMTSTVENPRDPNDGERVQQAIRCGFTSAVSRITPRTELVYLFHTASLPWIIHELGLVVPLSLVQ